MKSITGKSLASCLHSLVLLGLLLQALVPAGFMPARHRADPLRIEICTAAGFETVAVKSSGPAHKTAGDDRHNCAYAPVLGHALMPQTSLSAPVLAARSVLSIVTAFTLPRLPAKPWESQGPPRS
jgi:hypothetical protein